MKKVFFLVALLINSVTWADEIGDSNPSGEQQISAVLLVVGVIA